MVTTTLDNLQYFHLRLGPSGDLFQSLRVFLDEQELVRAFLLSTIGSLRRVVVNFPKALLTTPRSAASSSMVPSRSTASQVRSGARARESVCTCTGP